MSAPGNAVARVGLLLLLGLLCADALAAIQGGDLAWQRALGEHVLREHTLPTSLGAATFTAPDAHWVPHEWIFATLWALAQRAGLENVFRVACALVAAGAVAVDGIRARIADERVRAIVLALVVAGILPALGLRAQILAWPLLALALLALESGPRRAWWVVPISVVWFNLHASALMLPAIVVVHGVGRVLTERRPAAIVGALALAVATVLTSALTPFGIGYVTFAAAWTANPATDLIGEWLPLSHDTLPFFSAALVIVGLMIAGEVRGARLSWSQRLLTLGFLSAAILHVRNLPFFYIAAGPWVTKALTAVFSWRPLHVDRKIAPSDRGLVALGAFGAVAIAVAGAGLPKDDPAHASAAIARVIAQHGHLRVACEDFSWCSGFASVTDVRVFVDGRVDAYPKAILDQYRRLLAGDPGDILDNWHVDAVLTRRASPLARRLPAPRWSLAQDGETQLFVRTRARYYPFALPAPGSANGIWMALGDRSRGLRR